MVSVICLSCAGCFQAESNLKISDNGAVTMRNKILGAPIIAGIVEQTKNNLLEKNPSAKIQPVSAGGFSGYEVEIFYRDMESFAANELEIYQARPGKCSGVQISSGLFYDSCSFDLLIDGDKLDAPPPVFAESIIRQIKFDFAVELPYAAETSNADFMSNDGKILTWNIAPNLLSGQDKSIKLEFKIYHRLRIAATIFGALIFLAGVIFNLRQAKKPSDSD